MFNDNHVFIVAEIGSNHCNSFTRAKKLICLAKKSGVDAVKFQAFMPDSITMDIRNKFFLINKKNGQTLYDLYKKAYTPWKWFRSLKTFCDDIGICFFATCFDKKSVDFLEEINVAIHKVSSFELIDLDLIKYVSKTKKPLILSTGMSTVSETEEAINVAKKFGSKNITLLKCDSSYPANPDDLNLKTIKNMKQLFGCRVGFSDHSMNIGASIAAVALGSSVIEKHFTLSRKDAAPDSFFSIEPDELIELVKNIRIAEKSIGKVCYVPSKNEKKNIIFKRSLFACENIKKGERFTEENIRSIRPSYGLSPKYLNIILGKKSKTNISKGTPLKWSMI